MTRPLTPRTPRVPPDTKAAKDLRHGLGRWHFAVMAVEALDPATVEMIRLRAADRHDCHT